MIILGIALCREMLRGYCTTIGYKVAREIASFLAEGYGDSAVLAENDARNNLYQVELQNIKSRISETIYSMNPEYYRPWSS